jgi:hypothetical protein
MTSRCEIIVKLSEDYDVKFVASELRNMAENLELGYVLPNVVVANRDGTYKPADKHEGKVVS